jgi:hypothetical protein
MQTLLTFFIVSTALLHITTFDEFDPTKHNKTTNESKTTRIIKPRKDR